MPEPSAHRFLEETALAAVPALIVAIMLRVSWSAWSPLAIVVGYALADFVAGVGHWFADNIANEEWPWIGVNFVRPFRAHHVDPSDITRHGFIETNGNNAIAAFAPLVLVTWLAPTFPTLAIGAAAMLAGLAATNACHRWSHLERPPRYARALQRARIVLRPAEHARHHVKHDRAYAVASGWTNRLLDAMVSRAH